jgi:hypothetical protein
MRRQLSLALVAACLCAACAAPRPAETDVLVSKILVERPSNSTCQAGEVRVCVFDEINRQHCQCVEHHELFGPN